MNTYQFDSWAQYIDHIETTAPTMRNGVKSSGFRFDEYFCGVKSYKEALSMARDGWTKGEIEINETAKPLIETIAKQIERVEVNHDIEGHAIDVARFVDGEPECWLKFEEVIVDAENGRRLIRLVFNNSSSGGISTDTITRKGAAIVALIQLLEYAGHRVEVVRAEGFCDAHASGSKRDKAAVESYVKIKDFDQNLDVGLLAFALAHPASLRVFTFAWAETLPTEIRELIGRTSAHAFESRPTDVTGDTGDIYVGRTMAGEYQWTSAYRTQKWIIEQLQKQGVKIKSEVKV